MLNRKRGLYGNGSQATNSEIMSDNAGNKHRKRAATSVHGICPIQLDVEVVEIAESDEEKDLVGGGGATGRSQLPLSFSGGQQNLHASLKTDIAKLCKVLKLSEDVVHFIQKLLEYLVKNYDVNKGGIHHLRAFKMALCWIAADILGKKIDRKGSLLEARKILNFECSEDLANSVYRKLTSKKETFQQLHGIRSSNLSEPCVKAEVVEILDLEENQESRGKIDAAKKQKKLRKVQKRCEEYKLELRQKHEKTVQEFIKLWNEKREKLLKEHKAELAVFSDIHNPSGTKLNKLIEETNRFSAAVKDLECLKEWERREMEKKHDAEMEEEKRKCENFLAKAKAWYGSGGSTMINDSNANDATTGAPPITIASEVVILDVSANVETEVVGCGSPTDNEAVGMQVGIPVSTEQPDAANVSSQNPEDFAHKDNETDSPSPGSHDSPLPVNVIVNEIPSTNGDTEGELVFLGCHSGSLPEDVPSAVGMDPADCLKSVDLQSANATDNGTTEEPNTVVSHHEHSDSAGFHNLHVSDDCRSSTDLQEASVSDTRIIVDPADCDGRHDSDTAEELDKIRAGEQSTGDHAQNLVCPTQVEENAAELHKQPVLEDGEDNATGCGTGHEPGELFDSCQNHAFSEVAGNGAELQNTAVLSNISNLVSAEADSHVHPDLPPVSGIDHESNGEQFVGFQNPESISGVAANAVFPLPPHPQFAWHTNQWLLAEPLQTEFIKRCNEKEQVNKLYEVTISQLNAAFEKELQDMYAQMHEKYTKKLRDAESSCNVKKTEIEANHSKLVMNRFLAIAFRSKCRYLISSGSSDVVQPGAPSGLLHQQQFLSSSQSSLRQIPVASSSSLSQPATVNPVYSAQRQPVVSLASSQPATIQQTNTPCAQFTPRSLNPSLTHSRPPQISTITPTIGTARVGGSFVRAPAPHIQPFRPPSSSQPVRLEINSNHLNGIDRTSVGENGVQPRPVRDPAFSAVDLLKNVPNRTAPVSNNKAGWPLNRPNLRIPKKKKRQATDLRTPSQSQKRPTSASVEDFSFNNTASETARKNFKDYFMHRLTHRERGIDFKHVSKEIEAIIKHHDWDKFIEVRTNDLNLTMVMEFYAILSESSSLESVQSVKLRKTTVPFTPKAINEYFEILEIPLAQVYSRVWNLDDDKALTAKALEAKRFLAPKATTINKRFMFGSSTKDVRVMKHLVSHNLFPSFKVNTFNYEEACLTYAIMKKVPVDVGQIIFRKACEFAIEMKNGVNIPFPFLISDLCFEAQVKQLSSDDVYAPNEPLIGPSIQELKEKTPESEPSSSHTLPPSGEPITETSGPTSESCQFQVRGTRIHKLESDMDVLKKGLVNLNDNVVRGFDHITEALDNLRVGIRGHWEYHVQNPNCNDDDGFVNCQ